MATNQESTRVAYLNIIYLAVLGLLFMSQPDSLLDSFKKMRNTLDESRSFKEGNVRDLFVTFEGTKLKEEPIRAKPIYYRAKKADSLTQSVQLYLKELRDILVKTSGGINEETGDVKNNGNIDVSPRELISTGKALKLKEKIESLQLELTSLLDSSERKKIVFNLVSNDLNKKAIKKSWEQLNFGDGIPVTASLTNLARIQAEITNIQADIVKNILGNMDKAVVNLDQFSAVAVAPTSYLIQGQPYKAEIFLTAYDSKSNPLISVNGSNIGVSNGKGVYSVNTSSEGVHSWYGFIKVKQTDGTFKEYRTPEQKYQVSRPSAVVSPKKMNVFYVGVENPIAVSAPGIPLNKIRVSISNGTLSGSNGNYIAKVSETGTVKVNVSAEVSPGKVQKLSSSEFRAKLIPNPKAKFAGRTGGVLGAAVLRGQDYLSVVLEGFDFDAKFTLQRYTLIVARPRAETIMETGNGSTLSSAIKNALNSVTPGTSVIFTDIIAVGPDGVQRSLDPIAIRAN